MIFKNILYNRFHFFFVLPGPLKQPRIKTLNDREKKQNACQRTYIYVLGIWGSYFRTYIYVLGIQRVKVTKKKPWSIVCCGLCCIWPYTKVWPEYDFTFHHCPFVKHWRHPLNKKASNCKLSIACKCPNHTYSVGSVKTSCAPDTTLIIKIIFSQYSYVCISAYKKKFVK